MSFKLGHKIFLVALIPLGFVVVTGLIVAVIQQSVREAANLAQHSTQVLDVTRALQHSFADADSDQRGYLITADRRYLARFDAAEADVAARAASLVSLVADNPPQEAAAARLQSMATQRSRELRRTIGELRVAPPAVQRDAVLVETQDAEAFLRELDRFTATEEQLAVERNGALEDSIGRLDRSLLLSGVVALALTLFLLQLFGRDTIRRIAALGDKADRFARGLPLGPASASSADDEIARADRAFDEMAAAVAARQEVLVKFRMLAENIRDIILFVRRSDARLMEVNDAAVDAYGYTREELLGMTAADLRTPEAATRLAEHLERSDQGPVFYESVHRRKDGSTFPVEVTGAGATVNGQRVLVSIVRDVSDRKRAEAERERLFELSLDMMCVATFGGYFVRVNRAWERTLGYTRSELCAVPFVELIHPDDRDATSAAMRALTDGETVVGFENRYRRKDGTYAWFSWSAIPSLDDGLIYAVARDVTDRRRRDEELAKSRDQATEASRIKSEFLANMSHEIRTPMNGIIGTTALLQAMPMTADQREYVGIIRESGEALLAIINQILDLSKLEAGKVNLEVMDFSPISVVESVALLFAPAARQKGLSIQGYAADDVPHAVRGDAGQLRQVLINLAGNAVKFTDEGSVVIRAAGASFEGDEVVLRFSVADTGIGLPADLVGRLFEPFTQGDASTTRRYGGTGLGLSISKRIVELMRGEIGVEPNEDRGTTFWFTARFAASTQKVPVKRKSFDGVRVLIADRDPVSREVLHHYLHNWGMRNGLVAGTAQETIDALARAAEENDTYHIAFIDATIANETDVPAAAAADARLASTRLIYMKSLAADGGPVPPGFAYFLSKPIRQSYLFDCVTAALDGAAAAPPGKAPSEREPRMPLGAQRGGNILVAEDNEINRRLAAAQFKSLGVEVEFVKNGREAVDAVATGEYDLVFMDCQMPEMDGFEATRAIRKREMQTGAHTPIVAVTANAMEGDREACVARGMDDYLAKPVDLDGLRQALDRWLPRPIDMSRIRALFGEDHASVRSLLQATVEESKAVFGRLQASVAARDGAGTARAAHELKGFTGNVGARRVATLAAAVETAAASGDWEHAATLEAALAAAIDTMIDYAGAQMTSLDGKGLSA